MRDFTSINTSPFLCDIVGRYQHMFYSVHETRVRFTLSIRLVEGSSKIEQ